MYRDDSGEQGTEHLKTRRVLQATFTLGIVIPLAGHWALGTFLPSGRWVSLPFHSTLEMGGAALGLVLAAILLFARQELLTTRRLWIACALIAMAILDIFHSSVAAGNSFVWLHSLAVLAGGLFFSLVWYPETSLSRQAARATAAAVLLLSACLGVFSVVYPQGLPEMLHNNGFTPLASMINLAGGVLTVAAALNFAIAYQRTRSSEELNFLLLCLLFGLAAFLFPLSQPWNPDWWLWHLLRLGGYLFAFWLALLSFHYSEREMTRAHDELDRLFHVAVDGKRLVDRNFKQLRTNETFLAMTGLSSGSAENMKCYEAFQGSVCHTDQCPLRLFESGEKDTLEKEVIKTRQDGSKVICLLKAVRLTNPDGSFRGIIESFLDITESRNAEDLLRREAAIKTGKAELADLMRSDQPLQSLAGNILTFLCQRLKVPSGLMFLANENGTLSLSAGYAHPGPKHRSTVFQPGEGVIGQAAIEKRPIVLEDVPPHYYAIESGFGQAPPRTLSVFPIVHNDKVHAVVELASMDGLATSDMDFLQAVTESVAVAIESGKSRTRLAATLEESQKLAEELQAQQEELRVANEELEEQTRRLTQSEERLKNQQEELQVTNEELEEKNDLLERQKQEVERARREISDKAEELALASKYKSEFLANMSHELRSPLNSLLLLSQSLTQNRDGNLTPEQVEAARIIHGSGTDLLSLINDILDLAKIEAGRMDFRPGNVRIHDLAEKARTSFAHLAGEKGLTLTVEVTETAPAAISSDGKRIEQIIRNLLSNAVKFTEQGGVTLRFHRPATDIDLSRTSIPRERCLAVSVQDTGIGIAPDQQNRVFEAFYQADGGTTRKYGGTGLGLAISRELADLLGGEIRLASEPEKGSTFTLYLPIEPSGERRAAPISADPPAAPEKHAEVRQGASPERIEDDRSNLGRDDRVILVIEDDPEFARILYGKCHEKGFKCLAASTGEAGLELARRHLPAAILLDIRLPGMDGWAVLTALKEDIGTRHIPVHVISAAADPVESFRKGALGHVDKPLAMEDLDTVFQRLQNVAAGRPWRLLVVEDDTETRRSIVQLIGDTDVITDQAATGAQALAALRTDLYDCMVLDLGLPDMSGAELLAIAEREKLRLPPVVVHTSRDLTREEEMQLREHADSIVIKDVRSQERLLDEVSLFLHRMVSRMPEQKRKIIADLHDADALLKDRKILIVDDDMRTVFAMSRRLTDRGMKTLKAENGERALRILEEEPAVDLVLMDIMMPVMDGYEAIRRIRDQERFKKLPILALTAKAMPDDRAKCLAAGANDYLSKPVDEGRLFSMMRVWLHR